MSSFCVATLDTASGWETKSPEEALALHFTYWFTSRRNQGRVIGGVPSFYFLWAAHGKVPETLQERAREEFNDYLKELFPISEVSVEINDLNPTTSTYHLAISARIIVDNLAYDLAKVVLVTGEKYRILDEARLNNG